MFRRFFGRSPAAADNDDQDPDPETPDEDDDQDHDPENPDDDGDQGPDDEIPDADGDQDPNAETPNENGDQDPDAEIPDDDDDQSDSSDDSDDEDPDYYLDNASCSSEDSNATSPEFRDYPHPLNAPLPIAPWETDIPEIDPPGDILPDYIYNSGPEPPQDDLSGDEGQLDDILSEDGFPRGVDLFGTNTPQDVVSSDDETPEGDPPQEDPSQEDPSQEDRSQQDPPQEEPSRVEIISLHSSDDDDESDRNGPEPPNNNVPPGFQPVQCDWIPPVNGNYPGPGPEGVRCQTMSNAQRQVHPCDRGNDPLHPQGRNICHLHRAKLNVSHSPSRVVAINLKPR